MADSKLKLQIVTALDNAGIKATKEQIEGMEKSLNKLNQGGDGTDKLVKRLGHMPGTLGKIGGSLDALGGKIGAVGGQAMAVMAAWKIGWDIGTWINDNVVKPLFGIKDPLEELKKENKAIAEGYERWTRQMDEAYSHADELAARGKESISREIQAIDAESNAWQRATRSKIAYLTAGQDVETQMLARHRFEDVIQYQAAGDMEGADQVSKIYDILQAQLDAKQQIKKFDEETLAVEDKIRANREKESKLYDAYLAAQENWERKKTEYKNFEAETDQIVMDEKTYGWYRKKRRQYLRDIDKLNAEKELAWQTMTNFDVGEGELDARRLQRAALIGRTGLAVDQAAFAYDQAVAQNGERLNFEFTEEFRQAFEKSSRESEAALVEAITKGVSEGIGLLLQVKE